MNNLKSLIKSHMLQNKRVYILLTSCLAAGAVLGSIFASVLTAAKDEQLLNYFNTFFSAYTIQSGNPHAIFTAAFLNNLTAVWYIWLSGFFVFAIPFILFQVGLKGFKAGFIAAFLIKSYAFRGFLFAFFGLAPANLLLIPAMLAYSALNINFAVKIYKERKQRIRKSYLLSAAKRSTLTLACMLLILAVCGAIEGYIIPVLLKPVCSLFI